MASKTEIANLAVAHLGVAKTFSNLDTDVQPEAVVCRQFYDRAVRQTLRDFQHPFSTKFAALNLVEENPTIEWNFSYAYPSDCLHARRIVSGIINETRQQRIPYRIVGSDEGRLIYTNQAQAELEYTMNIKNPDLLPDDLLMAISFRLAHYIAPSVTKGDPTNMGKRAMDNYTLEILLARSTASNEEQPEENPVSEFERFREG